MNAFKLFNYTALAIVHARKQGRQAIEFYYWGSVLLYSNQQQFGCYTCSPRNASPRCALLWATASPRSH